MVDAQDVVVAAQVAADTPVAENAATRASTNREMTIFLMIHLLCFTQVGLLSLVNVNFVRFRRYKNVLKMLGDKLLIIRYKRLFDFSRR